jgi:tetratricopeptide (TPR) repeat protein
VAPHESNSGEPGGPRLDSILVLTRNEIHARRDKESAKRFRPTTLRWLTSGAEALDYLNHQSVDVVMVDSELDDMRGIKFLQLVRKNLNLQNVPLVMVTMDNQKNDVLDAISAGCTGYVLRPYSMATFERHISFAHQIENYKELEELQLEDAQEMVEMGEFDDAIETFEEIIQIQDEAQKYYDLGCHYLERKKFGRAIVAFKKAVKINNLYAEAYRGLAEAYKGKGDLDRYQDYLLKAAEIHAQFDRMEETKQLFIEILKYGDAPNPYNTLGVRLRRQNDFVGALHAYEQALELTPEDGHIYYNIAKCFFMMGQRKQAVERLKEALELNPRFNEAMSLYTKITGREYVPSDEAIKRAETAGGEDHALMLDNS